MIEEIDLKSTNIMSLDDIPVGTRIGQNIFEEYPPGLKFLKIYIYIYI